MVISFLRMDSMGAKNKRSRPPSSQAMQGRSFLFGLQLDLIDDLTRALIEGYGDPLTVQRDGRADVGRDGTLVIFEQGL